MIVGVGHIVVQNYGREAATLGDRGIGDVGYHGRLVAAEEERDVEIVDSRLYNRAIV